MDFELPEELREISALSGELCEAKVSRGPARGTTGRVPVGGGARARPARPHGHRRPGEYAAPAWVRLRRGRDRGVRAPRRLARAHRGEPQRARHRAHPPLRERGAEAPLSPAARSGGRSACVWGLTEPGSGSDAASLKTTAVRSGDGWVLNGTKTFITQGSVGDTFVVLANTDAERKQHGITAFVLGKGIEGLLAAAHPREARCAEAPTRPSCTSRTSRRWWRSCSATCTRGS